MPLLVEKELEGLKREMDQLAEHLDDLGDAIDTDQVAEILRLLAMGKTATFIIDIHDLKADGV